jgi:hypothetical protein
MKNLVTAIARTPSYLRQVEWRDLERMLREVFEQIGFTTELTRSTKDGGFDLRLLCLTTDGLKTFLVEVKHWLPSGQKPGSRVLAALMDVVVTAGELTTGVLLSSSGFSQHILKSRSEIEQHRVRIAGQTKIISLCQIYLQSIDGLWIPTTDLADLLLDGTM